MFMFAIPVWLDAVRGYFKYAVPESFPFNASSASHVACSGSHAEKCVALRLRSAPRPIDRTFVAWGGVPWRVQPVGGGEGASHVPPPLKGRSSDLFPCDPNAWRGPQTRQPQRHAARFRQGCAHIHGTAYTPAGDSPALALALAAASRVRIRSWLPHERLRLIVVAPSTTAVFKKVIFKRSNEGRRLGFRSSTCGSTLRAKPSSALVDGAETEGVLESGEVRKTGWLTECEICHGVDDDDGNEVDVALISAVCSIDSRMRSKDERRATRVTWEAGGLGLGVRAAPVYAAVSTGVGCNSGT
eukprot:CAMPEP_0115870606 /NCGR_PEP_ID=MMETSP0287-20121206/22414_1 /TAXON_ID=412157 /ORGANISM="Chrysochromulina rotalis, Strain UIO044" /LENGTH=299 /DNA_ID=CAMNT_0003325335 /DNA_START=51 /DNA_END=947 /DNA_ORIENTATION=+